MVSPKDWLTSQGRDAEARDDKEAILALREEWGKSFRSKMAETTGVSKDTAGRWLQWAKGDGGQRPSERVPGRTEKIRQNWNRIGAARKIRKIKTFRPRQVEVISKSSGDRDGFRRILNDINLESIRDEIADLIEAGDDQGAAELLDQALIAGYGGEDVHYDEGLAAQISIADFRVDPDVIYE